MKFEFNYIYRTNYNICNTSLINVHTLKVCSVRNFGTRFLKQYLSYLMAYFHQVRVDFKFSFDKAKKWLHLSFFIMEKMVKEGMCLLSFIKYINLFFNIINASLTEQWLPIIIHSSASSLVISSAMFLVWRNSVKWCQKVCVSVQSQKSGLIVFSLLLHNSQKGKFYLILK